MEEPGKKAWVSEKVVTRQVKASYKIHLKLSSKKTVRAATSNSSRLCEEYPKKVLLADESALNFLGINFQTYDRVTKEKNKKRGCSSIRHSVFISVFCLEVKQRRFFHWQHFRGSSAYTPVIRIANRRFQQYQLPIIVVYLIPFLVFRKNKKAAKLKLQWTDVGESILKERYEYVLSSCVCMFYVCTYIYKTTKTFSCIRRVGVYPK